MLIDGNPAAMIKVTPSDMRRAAGAWDDARDQVGKADPTDRVPEVATAMPGGAATRQVTRLTNELHGRFKSWREGATEQAEALRKATREYETADQQAVADGRKQESVVSYGLQNGPSGITVSRGPAVFNPRESPSDRSAYLDKRMNGCDL